MNKPKLGDTVEVLELEQVYTGKVHSVLSAQFGYTTPQGESRMCLYSQLWKIITDTQGD